MDRPVQESVLRRQRNLRVLAAVGGVIVLVLAVMGFRWLLRPELDRSRLRTGLAERGTIEATITSSGTVVPSSEEIVPSPITSRVVAVYKRPGDAVEPGDLILELDTGQTKLELSNTEEEIALKRNDERTSALSMRNSLNDFQGQLELKQIDLESQEAKLARFKILERDGLVSGEQLLETELDVRRARVEIRQREQAIENLRESTGPSSKRSGSKPASSNSDSPNSSAPLIGQVPVHPELACSPR